MKFFVDTANLDEVKKANAWGILDGVTTNPSLIAKEGVPYKDRVLEICKVVGPGKAVSAECIEADYDKMLAEAKDKASWHENIYVKVPMTPAGVEVMATLSPQGVRFNCTLVFSVPQGLIAAKAGASFISFFVGRVDDMGSGEAMESVVDAVNMLETYNFPQKPEILVASIRSPLHVLESVRAGAQIATVPYKILEQLFHHPLTDIGIQRFTDDYKHAIEEMAKHH
ncbi:MAG TPA: transaldolase family protein [Capsulimonadaceae bacterium]|nr:transaldolase family protein [Capsulimonadaceae bacterium]